MGMYALDVYMCAYVYVCVGVWVCGCVRVSVCVSFEGIGGPQGQAGRMFSTSPGQTLSASSTARRYVLGSL